MLGGSSRRVSAGVSLAGPYRSAPPPWPCAREGVSVSKCDLLVAIFLWSDACRPFSVPCASDAGGSDGDLPNPQQDAARCAQQRVARG